MKKTNVKIKNRRHRGKRDYLEFYFWASTTLIFFGIGRIGAENGNFGLMLIGIVLAIYPAIRWIKKIIIPYD